MVNVIPNDHVIEEVIQYTFSHVRHMYTFYYTCTEINIEALVECCHSSTTLSVFRIKYRRTTKRFIRQYIFY